MQGRGCGIPTGSRLAAHPLKTFTDGSRRRTLPLDLLAVLGGEPRSIPVDGCQSVKAQRSGVWMEVRLMQAR
jgi:hypothetical protein